MANNEPVTQRAAPHWAGDLVGVTVGGSRAIGRSIRRPYWLYAAVAVAVLVAAAVTVGVSVGVFVAAAVSVLIGVLVAVAVGVLVGRIGGRIGGCRQGDERPRAV